jgi:hypothetical protein
MRFPALFLVMLLVGCGEHSEQVVAVDGSVVVLESTPVRAVTTNSMRIEGTIPKEEIEEIIAAISHVPKIELDVRLVRKDQDRVKVYLPSHIAYFATKLDSAD